MTLLEAMKSKKRTKRPNQKDWYGPAIFDQDSARVWGLTVEELFATDWEVEQPKKELCRKDIEEAFERAEIAAVFFSGFEKAYIHNPQAIDKICKELGL